MEPAYNPTDLAVVFRKPISGTPVRGDVIDGKDDEAVAFNCDDARISLISRKTEFR